MSTETQRCWSYGNEEGLPAELTLNNPLPHQQQQQQNTHAFASPFSLSSSHSATVQDATVVASGPFGDGSGAGHTSGHYARFMHLRDSGFLPLPRQEGYCVL